MSADVLLLESLALQPPVDIFVLFVKEVPDPLKYGDRICPLLGMLPKVHQMMEKLIDIGHIEISGQDQVPGLPVVLPQKGMAGLNGIPSVGAVSQVAEIQLAYERDMIFEPIRIV